jgi:hypothetical protein
MPDIVSTSGHLHSEFVRILFLQTHRETDRFLKFQEFSLRVNLLVYSLSLHRHSYIGFILPFDSSIHNKQQHLS